MVSLIGPDGLSDFLDRVPAERIHAAAGKFGNRAPPLVALRKDYIIVMGVRRAHNGPRLTLTDRNAIAASVKSAIISSWPIDGASNLPGGHR
jgi:hypothetical protein